MKPRFGTNTHQEFKTNFQNFIFLAGRPLKIGRPEIGITELDQKLFV